MSVVWSYVCRVELCLSSLWVVGTDCPSQSPSQSPFSLWDIRGRPPGSRAYAYACSVMMRGAMFIVMSSWNSSLHAYGICTNEKSVILEHMLHMWMCFS